MGSCLRSLVSPNTSDRYIDRQSVDVSPEYRLLHRPSVGGISIRHRWTIGEVSIRYHPSVDEISIISTDTWLVVGGHINGVGVQFERNCVLRRWES